MLSANEKTDVKVDYQTTSILPQTSEESSISAIHLKEFRESAIDDEIAKLNFKTLEGGEESFDYLLYALGEKGYTNPGVLRREKQKQYDHLYHGGWWCKCLDPETGEERLFGQFKPNQPRTSKDGKTIKYESPPKDKEKAFFLEPSRKAWEAIAKRYKKKVPNEPTNQFWQWVKADKDIPIILTEGGKKDASLLSAAYATIGLVGVWNGCKKLPVPDGFPNARKEEKDGVFHYFIPKLILDLELFATEGRTFIIAFDHDENPNTKKNVTHAIERTAKLLEEKGCTVKISQWNSCLGKGADDVIYNHGAEIFHEFISNAKTLKQLKTDYQKEQKDNEIKRKLKGKSQPKTVPYNKMNYVEKAYTDLFEGDHWITIEGEMHLWNGKYYEPVPEAEIERKIVNWLREYEEPIYVKGEPSDRVIRYTKSIHLNEVLKWAKHETIKDPQIINPKGLNLDNGVLKIEWQNYNLNYELIPHDPDQYYTYCSQAKYNPDASREDCDKLLSALDPEQQDIFLKLVAASFDLETLRGFPKIGRIPAALCIGQGSNGKDSLRETVRLLFGNQGIGSYSFSDFRQYDKGTKFEIASLINNVRLSWSPENTAFLSLDNLIALRKAISGETIISRSLHKEGKPFDCKSVFFFNVNELPMIQGDMTAIQSRYCILEFNKTYKKNADSERGEIEADPRFKYDKNFLRDNILSAFLNRVLEALARLPKEGIDTTATEAAFETARRENNHLLTFCDDMGLVEDDAEKTPIKEIWDKLLWWYEHENGVLSYVGERKVWEDQVHPYDKNIKAINQLSPRLLKIFPHSQKKHGKNGNLIFGISFNPKKARLTFTSQGEDSENPDEPIDTSGEHGLDQTFTSCSPNPDPCSPGEHEKQKVNVGERGVNVTQDHTEQEIQPKGERIEPKIEEPENLIEQCKNYIESCTSLDEYHEVKNSNIFSSEVRVMAWKKLTSETKKRINSWIRDRDIASAVADFEHCNHIEVWEVLNEMYKPDILTAALAQLSPERQAQIDRIRNPQPDKPKEDMDTDGHFRKGDPVIDLTRPKWGVGEVVAISEESIQVRFLDYATQPMKSEPDNLRKEGDTVSWHKGNETVAFCKITQLKYGHKVKIQGDSFFIPRVVKLEELRCL